jgi:ribose transport system permease protein
MLFQEAPATGWQTESSAGQSLQPLHRLRTFLSFRNASVLYVFIAIFAVFSLWVPNAFLTTAVWRTLLDAQAVTVIASIGLVIPLAAGVFDLAVGAEVGFGAILVAALLAKQDLPIPVAILLTIAGGAAVGLVNGLLITRARIDSFIATLGVSSILLAFISWISGSQQILGLSSHFQDIASNQLLGITYPVWIMLVLALVVWYVLEKTPAGRRVYATGGNPDAARLAGVKTHRVVVMTLVACGILTAIAGTLISSRIATGDPTVGPSYLLPAFSAVFLGSTQFRGGRFNVWGTVVAAYVLAVGIKGLQLAGAPVWIPNLFNGAALIVAVGLARYERTSLSAHSLSRLLRIARRTSSDADAGAVDS